MFQWFIFLPKNVNFARRANVYLFFVKGHKTLRNRIPRFTPTQKEIQFVLGLRHNSPTTHPPPIRNYSVSTKYRLMISFQTLKSHKFFNRVCLRRPGRSVCALRQNGPLSTRCVRRVLRVCRVCNNNVRAPRLPPTRHRRYRIRVFSGLWRRFGYG